ncbi:MAG: hypothetical protein COA57_07480 [Flavobacteriales bacterium]|nr:MAG: hypothetical protein COA57_07480 [Flavobacteriales bacterium]
MKRVLSISLLLTLLIATLGLIISKHYCGGHLVATQLYNTMDEEDCCGDENPEDGCCDDETLSFQFEEDYLTSSKKQIKSYSTPIVVMLPQLISQYFSEQKTTVYFLNYKPPLPWRDIPVFTLSFLI